MSTRPWKVNQEALVLEDGTLTWRVVHNRSEDLLLFDAAPPRSGTVWIPKEDCFRDFKSADKALRARRKGTRLPARARSPLAATWSPRELADDGSTRPPKIFVHASNRGHGLFGASAVFDHNEAQTLAGKVGVTTYIRADKHALAGSKLQNEAAGYACEAELLRRQLARLHTLRPWDDYHEDMGDVLCFHLPICEPPIVAHGLDQELDVTWHTHWAPLLSCNDLVLPVPSPAPASPLSSSAPSDEIP